MSPWNTSQRAVEEQERRRRFQKEIPARFCPRCSALAYTSDPECFDCEALRPRDGWPMVEQSPDPWLGRTIEQRYLVTKPLATGHGSRLYRADSRIIPRSFAIKLMDVAGGPDLDQEGLRRRLRREVEALSSLRNPHIVAFYDVVELPDDQIAFVMDLIDGLPLDAFVEREGALDVPRALGLVRQLANGVFEAHESGLVHHDLKPSNVLVEKLPAGDDFVRILDFGVVWVRGTVASTGAFDVRPVFSSPEQVRDEETDLRTDIYSIGALAFLILTGKPPFGDDSIVDLVNAVQYREAPTLEDVAGQEFPASVEAFVARLLAKDPDHRPLSLSKVIERLDDILDELLLQSHNVEPDCAELHFHPGSTVMGLIPTLGEASSPVLKLEPEDMSDVSEARVETMPLAVACVGDRHAYYREHEVVWVEGTEQFATLWKPSAEVLSMAISDEFAIFTLSDGSIERVYRNGKIELMFQDPRRAPMTAVATDRAGKNMVAGSESGRLYACRGGAGWVRLGTGEKPVTALGLSARGDQFAVVRTDAVQIFSSTLSHTPTFPLPVDRDVLAVAFSSDDYLIPILTEGGTVVLASVITGQEFMRLDSGDLALRAVTFSEDNHLMGLFRDGSRVVLRALT